MTAPLTDSYRAQFAREVILWGSSKVVGKYSACPKAIRALPEGAHLAALLEFEEVLLAMREDLGHSNRGLKTGDVLRLFITDIDTALANKTKPDPDRPKDGGSTPPITPE